LKLTFLYNNAEPAFITSTQLPWVHPQTKHRPEVGALGLVITSLNFAARSQFDYSFSKTREAQVSAPN
jgi:hypothetical protein